MGDFSNNLLGTLRSFVIDDIGKYQQKRTLQPDERTGYFSVQPKESIQEAINSEMSTVLSDTHSFQEYYDSVKHLSQTYNNCEYSNPDEHEEYLHKEHPHVFNN